MLRVADPTTWWQYLTGRNIDRKLAAAWARFARPNIRLMPGPISDSDTTAIGASKLGGYPDLPPDFLWPVRPAYASWRALAQWQEELISKPRLLSFLAQINLTDVARIGCDLPLPDQGLLSFFYDTEIQPWGTFPGDRVGMRVLYFKDVASLGRAIFPGDGSLKSRTLELVASECLPDWMWMELVGAKPLGWGRAQFRDQFTKLNAEDDDRITYGGHSLAGWPQSVQCPMEDELPPPADDWRLLLQLDSDYKFGREWGTGGKLYFCCRERDMAARRFDRCEIKLQCA